MCSHKQGPGMCGTFAGFPATVFPPITIRSFPRLINALRWRRAHHPRRWAAIPLIPQHFFLADDIDIVNEQLFLPLQLYLAHSQYSPWVRGREEVSSLHWVVLLHVKSSTITYIAINMTGYGSRAVGKRRSREKWGDTIYWACAPSTAKMMGVEGYM